MDVQKPESGSRVQSSCGSFASVRAAVEGSEYFRENEQAFLGTTGSLRRLEKLYPLLRGFINKVRIAEGILSGAQLMG